MPDNMLIFENLMIAAAIFALVLSLWLVAVLLMWMRQNRRARLLQQRLGLNEGDVAPGPRILRLWHEGREAETLVPGRARLLQRWSRKLRELPKRAGWALPTGALAVGLCGTAVFAGAASIMFSRNWLLGVAVAIACPVLFGIYARHAIARQNDRFERQFVDALDLVARSLRAGHPLVGALQLAATELRPPVADLLDRVCQEQALGVPVEQALRSVAEKSDKEDLKLFSASIAIQSRAGGNLAEMMDRLAAVMRDRMRLARRARVATAQVQFSKRILLALPLIMLILLSLFQPTQMAPLYNTQPGHYLLAAGVGAVLLGWLTMNRLARLRY